MSHKKELTIDFNLYQSELAASRHSGFKEGLSKARHVVLELLAGASEETMEAIIEDSEHLKDLENDLRPRINRIKGAIK